MGVPRSRWYATLLGLLVLCWGAAARAEIPPEWLGARVVAIKVVGDPSGRVDVRSLGVPLGAPLNRALVRAAIERLGNQGLWSDVQVDALRDESGVTLMLHVVPRLLVHRVDVVGNAVLDDREIGRLLGLREQSEIDPTSFETHVASLREAYAERGHYAASISIALRDTDEPALKVVRVQIDEGPRTTIASVRFEGEALPRRRGVRRLLGVGIGDTADLTRIQEGLDQTEQLLRRNGYYAAELGTPRLERDGRKARVIVDSFVGPRFEVQFEGNGQISPSELFAALQLDQERFAGAATLQTIAQRVVELYRRYGFRDARATATSREEQRMLPAVGSLEAWEEHVMIVEVRIDTRAQLEIEAITFPGASHFSTSFLREQVHSYLEQELPGSAVRRPVDSDVADRIGFGGSERRREREVQRPLLLDPHRLFHASTYARAIEHVRELYRGDGFLQVEISEVALTPMREPNKAIAVISVTEGPRTFLHDVRIENNRQLSSRVLLQAAALTRDAPFSYLKLEEARVRMVVACQEEGFYFAKVEPSVRTSQDGTRAEVTFHVDEGYPVRVGAIEIRGAERSRRSMLEDRVRLVPGELYRPSLARETQDALLALDVFSSVNVTPDEPNLPSRVKTVVITVTERKAQWLGWSAGFSTGEGARGGLEYGYRNLFGSAVQASFRGQLGYQLVFLDREIERRYEALSPDQRTEYQVTLSLGMPYVPRLPKVRTSLDVSALTDIQRDFRMQKESGVASVIYRPVRTWTFTVAEELEFSDFTLFEQNLDNIGNLTVSDLVPEGRNTLLSTQLTTAWDRRDRAFNPHRGFLISVTSEWARTLSDRAAEVQGAMTAMGGDPSVVVFNSNMLRFTGSIAFYIPLGTKVTFASQTRYGRVVHLVANSDSYPNRRFYLGGTNFRGWYQNQMVPQDLEDKPGYSRGGVISRGAETFLATQNELRFPLAGEVYGGLFWDVGNLWADVKELDLRELESVVGLGLRLQTPVASLAFDYGIRAVRTGPFGMQGAFQFAFQTF